jgi:hypothetical protein
MTGMMLACHSPHHPTELTYGWLELLLNAPKVVTFGGKRWQRLPSLGFGKATGLS